MSAIGTEDHEIEETATRMLERYSSAKIAAEAALWHAMDHKPLSPHRVRWMAVRDKIKELSGT